MVTATQLTSGKSILRMRSSR